MKDKALQAEIWETQVWLMWILATLLFQYGHSTLATLTIIWSVITCIGVVVKLTQAAAEKTSHIKKENHS